MTGYLTLEDMLKEVGAIGGYADGSYVCRCRECERRFIGDKRASECLSCAVNRLFTKTHARIDLNHGSGFQYSAG